MRVLAKSLPGLFVAAAALGASACAGGQPATQTPTPGGTDGAAVLGGGYPTSPPPPLEERPLDFPPFSERSLPNGLRLIVVEQHDLPVVNLDLYVESGSASDPPELAGLTGMVADLLTKGTPTRTAEEIASTIEGVGGQLSASAGQDFLRVGATVLAEHTDLAFDLVSDVSLRPTFPEEELNLTRRRMLTSLQAELANPGAVASRHFAREVYGTEHPYRLAPEPVTVEAIDRSGVAQFHEEHFKADNALLVVSGDVSMAQVEELVGRYFGEWQGGGAPEPTFVEPPARNETRIHLVHRPGSVQSAIRLGHVGIRPDNPDYYPLQVLNKVLGSGTDSRLFLILREQRGWTYGAYSSLSRPLDVGTFSATAEVRNEVTDSAVVEMLAQLRRLREEPVSQAEMDAAKSFLTGSFPLRIETPGAIAQQVAQIRLLGLPIEALTDYRERIAAVTAQDVQRVAQEYVRPDQAAIVVVGDATQILSDLQGIAPITLTDVSGNPLDPADLEIRSSGASFDASRLSPVTLTYQVVVQGTPFGTATTTLSRDGAEWSASTVMQAGPLNQRSEVRFDDSFTPVSLTSSAAQGPMEMGADLQYENGRVTGEIRLPEQMGGQRAVDVEVPEGTLLTGMDAFALSVADLAVGETVAVPIFSEQSGSVTQATFEVTGEEEVTVPAGTFQAFRVQLNAGPQSGTLWLRRDAPHVTLRQEVAGQPVVIELQGEER